MKLSFTLIGIMKTSAIDLDDVTVLRSKEGNLYLETPFLEPDSEALVSEDGNAVFSALQLLNCGDPLLEAIAESALERFPAGEALRNT